MQIETQQAAIASRALQAGMLSRALRMYAKTGMIPTRGYTATKMLAAASALTGVKFKRGQYERAAQACDLAQETNEQILAIVRENPDIDAEGIAKKLQLAAKTN